jgi:hypothetical protein
MSTIAVWESDTSQAAPSPVLVIEDGAQASYRMSAASQTWHRLLTHYMPLYFREIERFAGNSRSDRFLALLERFPTPTHLTALGQEALAYRERPRRVSHDGRAGPRNLIVQGANSWRQALDRAKPLLTSA